jgi:hypothetical protein
LLALARRPSRYTDGCSPKLLLPTRRPPAEKRQIAHAVQCSHSAHLVVITTVAPKPGEVRVSYNFTGTLEYPDLTDYNMMNAREKLETEDPTTFI